MSQLPTSITIPATCEQCNDPNPTLHEQDGDFCNDTCVTNYRVSEYRLLRETLLRETVAVTR